MRRLYPTVGKRVLDVVGASTGLVLAGPLLAAVAGLVRLRLGSPVLFTQRRPGRHGRPFTIVKLRTMTDARHPDGTLRSDAERLTPFGRWLRRTSLDELPELWNVLRGDMSLVGPRPLLMEYLPLYSARQARRHELRPGITGLAQVQGRNAAPWSERLEADVRYVEQVSLALDLRILARTVVRVLQGSGVNEPGQATVSYFRGNP
ncbi:MAG: sugar transferase [Myxococcales bacterium]|nr:sugar transferase [Myxococcales bacterium]MCB9713334.1 sugar transferase [Myxococcales bacterium]